jgi:hypothetical protein
MLVLFSEGLDVGVAALTCPPGDGPSRRLVPPARRPSDRCPARAPRSAPLEVSTRPDALSRVVHYPTALVQRVGSEASVCLVLNGKGAAAPLPLLGALGARGADRLATDSWGGAADRRAAHTPRDVHLVGGGEDDPVRPVGAIISSSEAYRATSYFRASSGPTGPGSTIETSWAERLTSTSSMCRRPINPAPATAIRIVTLG